ncbi:hypothetical protein ABZ896_52515, partial [Streptomyces sp. NPDC047072]|uniref:hypothetical protein n=1 Tax=Streptomyces sp. NPDC047072 TaxID=3154809 RepID=UPI0033E50EA1
MTGIGAEAGAQAARSRALAVLRIRSRALAVALLPAAVAVLEVVGHDRAVVRHGRVEFVRPQPLHDVH